MPPDTIGPMRRALAVLLCFAACALPCPDAHGAAPDAARGPRSGDGEPRSASPPSLHASGSLVTASASRWAQTSGALPESHGWVVVPGVRGPLLLHIPPRGRVRGIDGTDLFARDGAVHHAAPLPRHPEALAAHGRRVYLLFPADAAPGRQGRREVMAFDVEPTALDGLWADKGGQGLRVIPSLPSGEPLAGAAADEQGLLVLLRGGEGARLVLLRSGAWLPVPLPPDLVDDPGGESPAPPRIRLIAGGDGVSLLAEGAGPAISVWQGRWPEPPSATESAASEPGLEWTHSSTLQGDAGAALLAGRVFWAVGRLWSASRDDAGAVHLIECDDRGERTLALIDGVGDVWGVVPLDQSGRAVVLWSSDPRVGPPSPIGGSTRYTACEVSLRTGRVLYRGAATAPTPVSPRDIRWLAAGLLVLMVVVLAVVLRSEGDRGVATLPDGFALAPPGSRMLAGLIDAAVAVVIARAMLREEWERVLDPSLSSRTLAIWGLALAVGFAHAALGEWLAGRSIGKALAGIRVVRIGYGPDPPPPRRPSLGAAIVRNGVRWLFAPYAAISVLDPAGRHRGDLIAKTAVVVPVPALPPENGPTE